MSPVRGFHEHFPKDGGRIEHDGPVEACDDPSLGPTADRPPVSREPTWECGASDGERPGYICGRPAGHKGMHRRRAEASAGAALGVEEHLLWLQQQFLKVADAHNRDQIAGILDAFRARLAEQS